MRTDTEILQQFVKWAENNNIIRAAILTSSRADPNSHIDFLSDYDIEMYVSDLHQFRKNDNWLKPLGKIMVRWPLKPRTTFDKNWLTRLILFNNGVRIDFQITDKTNIKPNHYDYGYKILIDKDAILKDAPKPTYSKFNISKPSKEEYETIVNEFWWNATYVPKYLWRDELPFAKSMMGQAVHDKYLRRIIEWYIGMQNNWSVNTGVCGRHFKRYLNDEIWTEFESTFTGANIEDNWNAFFNAVSLFGKLGKIIGNSLGYEYPIDMEKEMIKYYLMIRNSGRDDE